MVDRGLDEITDIEYVVAQYDAEIYYLDEKLAELFDYIAKLGIDENTLVIITADYGESLTKHGIYFGYHGLYEVNIHVPLIMRWPACLPVGKRVNAFFEHVDLAPTVLAAFGEIIPEGMEGRNLLDLLEEEEEIGEAIICGECTFQAKRAIRTHSWKFIKSMVPDLYGPPIRELYDLAADVGETNNVAEEYPEVVDEL